MITTVSMASCVMPSKMCSALAAMNEQFVKPLSAALCLAFTTAVSLTSTPLTCWKREAEHKAKRPEPQYASMRWFAPQAVASLTTCSTKAGRMKGLFWKKSPAWNSNFTPPTSSRAS